MRIAADHLFTGAEETAAGRIVIENGRIVETLPPGESDLDLGPAMICSGLVNSHVHLDLSLPRDSDHVPGEFTEWLKGVVDTRRQLGPTGLTEVAVRGIEESKKYIGNPTWGYPGCDLFIAFLKGGFTIFCF